MKLFEMQRQIDTDKKQHKEKKTRRDPVTNKQGSILSKQTEVVQ